MSDLESRLMRALAESQQSADERFVGAVEHQIESYEAARTVRLFALSVIALCLAGALGYGLYLSWNAARVMSMPFAMELSTTASMFSLVLVAIAFVGMRPRALSD